mmetsp:Transcript_116043/g.374865  ORF Transcript_116043/g.374865 Transcript_116043/m.374865 type:complete len:278 (+) Transcript_116043:907-1740(+)
MPDPSAVVLASFTPVLGLSCTSLTSLLPSAACAMASCGSSSGVGRGRHSRVAGRPRPLARCRCDAFTSAAAPGAASALPRRPALAPTCPSASSTTRGSASFLLGQWVSVAARVDCVSALASARAARASAFTRALASRASTLAATFASQAPALAPTASAMAGGLEAVCSACPRVLAAASPFEAFFGRGPCLRPSVSARPRWRALATKASASLFITSVASRGTRFVFCGAPWDCTSRWRCIRSSVTFCCWRCGPASLCCFARGFFNPWLKTRGSGRSSC